MREPDTLAALVQGPERRKKPKMRDATIERTLNRVPTLMGEHLLARRCHVVEVDAGKSASSPKPKAITLILVSVGVM
jgi:hypothetical protein